MTKLLQKKRPTRSLSHFVAEAAAREEMIRKMTPIERQKFDDDEQARIDQMVRDRGPVSGFLHLIGHMIRWAFMIAIWAIMIPLGVVIAGAAIWLAFLALKFIVDSIGLIAFLLLAIVIILLCILGAITARS